MVLWVRTLGKSWLSILSLFHMVLDGATEAMGLPSKMACSLTYPNYLSPYGISSFRAPPCDLGFHSMVVSQYCTSYTVADLYKAEANITRPLKHYHQTGRASFFPYLLGQSRSRVCPDSREWKNTLHLLIEEDKVTLQKST